MSDLTSEGGVQYHETDESYFEKRGLRRHAGVWSLWALGVGAVISAHSSGVVLSSEQRKTSAYTFSPFARNGSRRRELIRSHAPSPFQK